MDACGECVLSQLLHVLNKNCCLKYWCALLQKKKKAKVEGA